MAGVTSLGSNCLYAQSDDLTLTAFGQATLSTTGGLGENNRLGFGVEILPDRAIVFGRTSVGRQFGAGGIDDAALGQRSSAPSYRLGYELDPERRLGQTGLSGSDDGTIVIGADQKVNDQVTMRAENKLDMLGNRGSLTQSYGVRYSPSEALSFDGAIEVADVEDGKGGTTTRNGIALGVDHAPGEKVRFGIRGEYRTENSTDTTKDRDSWLIKAYSNWQTSDDWRLLADVKAIVSENETSSLRDGRYVEGNLGYAYRPVGDGRLNALLRYTYLEDLPGPDQVNLQGTVGGAQQKSQIISVDASYKLNKNFTLGGKYGYRFGEVAARGSNVFTDSQADLAVLRLDYHVVHNWDIGAAGAPRGA
ncbi:MAG: hypothetical protein U5N55_05625 [Cypionkella sp.]|nr:hypothetical protein [Cypionkella sp.]